VPLSAAQVRLLKRKAADNSLEVENLLKVAVCGDRTAVPLLRQLKADWNWSESGRVRGQLVVPFGRWADVVCRFLEDGYPGLVALATGKQTAKHFLEFCLAVLGELHTPESVGAVLDIGGGLIDKPATDQKTALRLVRALQEVMSPWEDLLLNEATAARVRQFVHRFLALKLAEHERLDGVWALRRVGDADSLALIESWPAFKNQFDHRWARKIAKDIAQRLDRAAPRRRGARS
jgi:hypothetical protein